VNLDISEEEAKEFAAYMGKIITLIPFSEDALSSTSADLILSAQATLTQKATYMEGMKSAIRAKYAGEDFVKSNDVEKINLLASVMLDSLQFAGGISVPSVINNVLALTHMASENKHDSLRDVSLDTSNYVWILWETLRKYAPVAGVPSWEKQEDGHFKHLIPNIAQALMDGSVFEDPLVFKDRGLDLYEDKLQSTGMPWAGPAVARFSDGTTDTALPHSHNCPAEDLSFRMMKAFLGAFIAKGGSSGWAAEDSESVTVTVYGASAVTLRKRGLTHRTGCAFAPSCNAGYSWVATEWCSWGRRGWLCEVL
jgi:hypothetical protein